MSTNGQGHMADATDGFRNTEDRSRLHRQRVDSFGSWSWIQYSSHVYRKLKAALLMCNIYVLLAFLPLGITARMLIWPSITIFVFNFLAIIPLSALVSYSADELSFSVGQLLGGLINATFGNAVELSVGIVALIHGEVQFVQSTMLGSILSDVLLVLGSCLFSAAHNRRILKFQMAVADSLSSLMIITATALILPTALYSTISSSEPEKFAAKILAFSRGSAVVLLFLYATYLYFQLGTHRYLFDDQNGGNDRNTAAEQQEPVIGPFNASIVLITATVGIVVSTFLLLDSVDDTAIFAHITKTFIATILIPIASNAPECASVIASSRNGNINAAIGVIVNSIVQIGLFVLPFLVILAWVLQQPMTLYFDTFQTTLLFLAVLVVNHLLQDGQYTWIQGAILVGLYGIIAIAFFLRP